MSPQTRQDRAVRRAIEGFRHDPLRYVMYAFDWGRPGTPLVGESGPEEVPDGT